jgi:hypothetical protein
MSERDQNQIIDKSRYVFWLEDIMELVRDGNYIRFIPTKNMTRIEQLNAMSRFFIYLAILFAINERFDEWMYIPIIGLVVIVLLYFMFENDEDGKRDELIRMKKKVETPVTKEPELNYRTYVIDDNGETIVIDIDDREQAEYLQLQKAMEKRRKEIEGDDTPDTEYELQAGYYDSDGNLHYGTNRRATQMDNEDDIGYSLEEMRVYEQARCRKPTKENPFMNASILDFNTANPPRACNADDEDIDNHIRLSFHEDMYRNLDDVFNRKNSQRQFFTVHHNTPNDQEAFARWAYKFPETCKTNQTRCLKYQDLRFKY